MIYKPHIYQDHATERIINSKAVGLFLGMGLGKTVITLTAIEELMYNYFEVNKVLVIAPLRVAEDTWTRESDKWDHLKHLKISKVLGTERQRLEALNVSADVYVINRENVPWLIKKIKWMFDMVVVDELSSFKSRAAERFKALRSVRDKIKRIVGLTGTPAPNGLIDLWPQVFLLDQGERLGKTIGGYRDRYFDPGKRNRNVIFEWKLKPGSDQAIYSKLSDICISMKAKDWLDLPERISRIVNVSLDQRTQEKYTQFEKDWVLEFLEGDTELTAASAAVLSNKLLQISNGAVYDDDKSVQVMHEKKLDALEDIIEAANGKSILVFYAYKHDRDRIKERFKARELMSARDIDTWNKGEINLLIAHPASAGHGLNLQSGGHIIVWFGLTWSLELYQQANARLDRQGQTESVIIHHLISEGTIDEDVMRVLERKEKGQEGLLDAVKAIIERVKR